jgi:IMP dehydrogenase
LNDESVDCLEFMVKISEIPTGLTFADVLLVPKKSTVSTRKTIDVSSNLTKKLKLDIPIVSSNMDTVTESKMAVEMARLGGIGFIHRFLSIEDQVNEVQKVKRAESLIIENPYSIFANNTIKDARLIMQDKDVSGLMVIDSENKLIGILTKRDILFADDKDRVEFRMTKDVITGKVGMDSEEAKVIMYDNRIEKLPIVDEKKRLTALITVQDIIKSSEHPNATKDEKGRLVVGAAVGVKGQYLERTEALVESETDVIVVDIAHGHSELAMNAIKEIKKNWDIDVIAGNVATAEGTRDLIAVGADGVKIGVGPGSICVTRIVTGSGVPQLTAIMEASLAAREEKIPTIADGGIRTSGDLTKALLAGADTAMLGSLLAGTEESPGLPLLRDGKRFKVIRGMASFGASLGREARLTKGAFDEKDFEDVVPEGVEALVPYKGNVADVINQLIGGLKSGISYSGGLNLREARKIAEFIRITGAGRYESGSHDVEKI